MSYFALTFPMSHVRQIISKDMVCVAESTLKLNVVYAYTIDIFNTQKDEHW